MKEFIELHTFITEGFTFGDALHEENFFIRYESIDAIFTCYEDITNERYTKICTKGDTIYYVTEWKQEIIKLIEEAKKS